MATSFIAQCNILAQMWIDYREDVDFKDFVEYNDLGLPLAYFIAEGVALPTDLAETYIGETFDILIASLDIEDVGFETLDELFDLSEK